MIMPETVSDMASPTSLQNSTVMSLTNWTLPETPYPSVPQIIIMWVLPLAMVFLNILVFIVVPRMKTIRPCTGFGMISLAAADFSLGIVHLIRLSFNSYSHFHLEESHPICIIDGFGQALFASVSIATLTYMNMDRLLTVAFPLKYPRYLTATKVHCAHACIWGFMICLLAPTITGITGTKMKYYEHAFMCVPDWGGGLSYNLVVFTLVEIIPTSVIMVCFIGVFYFARHRNPKLTDTRCARIHDGRQAGADSAEWKRDMRIFRTLALMTFGFYIAWTPYFVTVALPEMIIGRSLHPITDFITPWLGASNSFWNPVIYIPTMRPFSKAMREIAQKWFPRVSRGGARSRRGAPVNPESRSGTQENVNSVATQETGVPSHDSGL